MKIRFNLQAWYLVSSSADRNETHFLRSAPSFILCSGREARQCIKNCSHKLRFTPQQRRPVGLSVVSVCYSYMTWVIPVARPPGINAEMKRMLSSASLTPTQNDSKVFSLDFNRTIHIVPLLRFASVRTKSAVVWCTTNISANRRCKFMSKAEKMRPNKCWKRWTTVWARSNTSTIPFACGIISVMSISAVYTSDENEMKEMKSVGRQHQT